MNNYCTNCGKKLEKDDLICKNCNTPIIDIPHNYNKKKEKTKKTLIKIGKYMLFIVAFFLTIIFINKIKINKLQKEYVEPYLKEHYSNLNYSIKYNYSGKCIISGNCYFDFVMG